MLRERREMARVLDEQVALARQFVAAASARYSSGTGNQPEVLRAESEVARFEGVIPRDSCGGCTAEAMLNASLGRPADAVVPPLEATPAPRSRPAWTLVRDTTLRRRPELEGERRSAGAGRDLRDEGDVLADGHDPHRTGLYDDGFVGMDVDR